MTRENGEHPHTYFIQERTNGEELARLSLPDEVVTTAMGGVLPEQPDPAAFHYVLDVACGPGGWLITTARTYPTIARLVGVDISRQMVAHAREQAEQLHLSDRVEFQVMDALAPLTFPDEVFDLVNLRLGMSFVRLWDWPRLLTELLRVTRPGGVIRLTEPEVLHPSSSPALTRLGEVFLCAFARAGHLFKPTSTGLTAHLAPLLHQPGWVQVQQQVFPLLLSAGTEAGQAYADNVMALLKGVRPFLERRGCLTSDDEALAEQVQAEMQCPDFQVTWTFHTVWGKKREQE